MFYITCRIQGSENIILMIQKSFASATTLANRSSSTILYAAFSFAQSSGGLPSYTTAYCRPATKARYEAWGSWTANPSRASRCNAGVVAAVPAEHEFLEIALPARLAEAVEDASPSALEFAKKL